MKDECAGRPILEYVGLRPKMYSILEDNNIKYQEGKRSQEVCSEKTDKARTI